MGTPAFVLNQGCFQAREGTGQKGKLYCQKAIPHFNPFLIKSLLPYYEHLLSWTVLIKLILTEFAKIGVLGKDRPPGLSSLPFLPKSL